MKYFIGALAIAFGAMLAATDCAAQGTLLPIPAYGSPYTGSARGFWFTAPRDFTIVGLRVPTDASAGPQSVHLMRFTAGPPPAYAATTSAYTTLNYTSQLAGNTIIAVSIPVANGDVIGVLGTRDASTNAYATPAGTFNSMIGTFPVTLTRLLYQGSIQAAAAPNVSSEAGGAISRTEIYYDIGPTLSTSTASLNLGAAALGTAGTSQQYTLTGSSLTGATTITAPAGVEISFAQASGYAPSLQVAAFPTIAATTIYARITAAAPVGPVSGNIGHASAGAPNKDVAVAGNVCSLGASQTTLNLGIATIGGPGAPQSYDLTGAGLVAATTVTAVAGFEVATNISGPYGPTANIATTPAYVQSVFVRLTGAALGPFGGNITNVSGPANVNIAVTGTVVPPDNLGATRNGPNNNLLVDNNDQGGGGGIVLLDFSLATIQSPWTVADLTFTASGTADEQTGLSLLALYEDNAAGGNSGVYDGPFVDLLATATTGVSFNGPNGTFNAVFSNSAWPAGTTRRFFLVCKLAGKATVGETLHAELTGVNATPSVPTGILTGVPTAAANDAFTINSARMTVSLNGPVVYATLNNNAQGDTGDGVVVCDLRITPKNDSWVVSSITFAESGTIDGQADVSFLGLHVDNGNGVWDGPGTDTLATAAAGVNFNAADGVYVAGLTASASNFAVNQIKRFMLVAKLAGTASSLETLRVSVAGIVQASPSGGSTIGVPSGATSAIMINVPTLTVNAGPANPATITREKNPGGFVEMIGQLRLSASNSNFLISGLTLTTGGGGSWAANLDAASGVQLFRDNGNGTFDAGDILLFSSAGTSPSVNCVFGANQTIAMNTDVDLWIVLNALATAGASPAESFTAEIASAANVNSLTAGGTVRLGTLAPKTGELRVVDFSVTKFSPLIGLLAGGQGIKIEGSGFALPVTLTIGGVPCTGTAGVNESGTEITGMITPTGTGVALPVVLTTNNLPAKTLPESFTYSNVAQNTNTGSTTSNNGCVAEVSGVAAALVMPALLAFAGMRRRRSK